MTLALSSRWLEKRRNRRLVVDFPVGVAILTGPFRILPLKPMFDGTVRDASLSGVRILTRNELPAGAHVRLWIRIGTGADVRTVVLRGGVAWLASNAGDAVYSAGIALRGRRGRNVRLWQEAILQRLRSHQ